MTNQKCPECGSKHFYREPEKAEKVCAKCGLVLKESMVDAEDDTIVCDDTDVGIAQNISTRHKKVRKK
ncbi:MAG TPA: hypothetical protein HA230_04420 [Candidatus Aenigmarchaeota archaeon]|nr:hypothetical protein [Candidatus Aenigmarchaeota archaeon]